MRVSLVGGRYKFSPSTLLYSLHVDEMGILVPSATRFKMSLASFIDHGNKVIGGSGDENG